MPDLRPLKLGPNLQPADDRKGARLPPDALARLKQRLKAIDDATVYDSTRTAIWRQR